MKSHILLTGTGTEEWYKAFRYQYDLLGICMCMLCYVFGDHTNNKTDVMRSCIRYIHGFQTFTIYTIFIFYF